MKFRKIYNKQEEILENKKLIFIVWPRQVGKTTFLKKIFSSLNTENKQFLNLENIEYHKFFKKFSDLENFINKNYNKKYWERFYLFLDEFQKVKDIDYILKLIYDEMPFVKVILSGSNNIEINKNIKESFAGRKRIYYMWPLDFEEFVIWKENLEYEKLERFMNNPINEAKIKNYLKEYMIWWAYPDVVLESNQDKKKQILSDIFDFWFNRDIVLYTKKMYEFKELTRQLAYYSWNILNYAKLASLSNLSSPTVKQFIEILKETFIVFTQRPFFRNKLKEINKAPKLYFIDPWFRNWFINRFEFFQEEYCVLFENFIFSDLIKTKYRIDELKFWRTSDEKYEVDLVIEHKKKAYELKYKENLRDSDLKWLKKFSSLYPDFETKVINKTNFYEEIIKN